MRVSSIVFFAFFFTNSSRILPNFTIHMLSARGQAWHPTVQCTYSHSTKATNNHPKNTLVIPKTVYVSFLCCSLGQNMTTTFKLFNPTKSSYFKLCVTTNIVMIQHLKFQLLSGVRALENLVSKHWGKQVLQKSLRLTTIHQWIFHFNENMNSKICGQQRSLWLRRKCLCRKGTFLFLLALSIVSRQAREGGRTKQPLSGFSLRIFSSQNTVLAQNRPPGKRDCAGKV